MKFVSTKGSGSQLTLAEAVDTCMAPDGGQLMPAEVRRIPAALFNNIAEMNLREIAFVVADTLLGDDLDSVALKAVVDDAFAVDIPLRHLYDDFYALELFHGPSLTFKDYGARFMAGILRLTAPAKRRTVVVASTGNTAAATASGFLNEPGVDVIVLYPRGRLSRSQISLFASLGGNIHPVEVAGTIEDCKVLLLKSLAEPSLADFNITAANSINIARLIPQVSFAMYAYARLASQGVKDAARAIYSIPCGNGSNLVAAAIARRMGLPAGTLIAATNANNQFRNLLQGSEPVPGNAPVPTLAPSTDMAYPSSWPRLSWLYGGDLAALNADITVAPPVDNTAIADTVNLLRRHCNYTIDPHGAMAFSAAVESGLPGPKVIFATGHPARQLDIMTGITGAAIELPVQLTRFMSGSRHAAIIPPTIPALRKILLSINPLTKN